MRKQKRFSSNLILRAFIFSFLSKTKKCFKKVSIKKYFLFTQLSLIVQYLKFGRQIFSQINKFSSSIVQCQSVLYRRDGIGVGVDGHAGPCMGQCMGGCMGGGDVVMLWVFNYYILRVFGFSDPECIQKLTIHFTPKF